MTSRNVPHIRRCYVIISFDALSSRDLAQLKHLEGFKRLYRDASYCETVKSVYPSLTYPAHTSISTGLYPMNHGVVANTLLQPGREKPDWNWTRDRIRADTFYDAAMRLGLTTCALLWPVTGRSNITYNLPEIFANRPWQNQVAVSLRNGTPGYLLELERRFGKIRKDLRQPQLDNFVHESALWTLKEKRPNVMMIHYVDLDYMRHHFGYHSKEADEALLRHDRRLVDILNLLEEEGMMADTTVFVLGDHDQIEVETIMYPNSILRDKGYIETKMGSLTDYKAYVHTLDGSAYIYLKDPEDERMKEEVRAVFEALMQREDFGIEHIYDQGQAAAFGANRKAAFMLEAKKGFLFLPDHNKPALEKIVKKAGYNDMSLSTHGFSPEKPDYTTVFFAMGKGIRKNVVIEEMSLVDEGPTFAHLMGNPMVDTDGRILKEILE